MDYEKLPIKLFAKRKVDEQRTEGGASSKPSWVLKDEALEARSKALSSALDGIHLLMDERISEKSLVPFIFTAKLEKKATSKTNRREVKKLLQTNKHSKNLIGLTTSDNMLITVETKSDLDEISNRISSFEQNDFAISCLENFEVYAPSVISTNPDENYKIKLVDFQNHEKNSVIHNLLEDTLNAKNIIFKKTEYSDNNFVYKIENSSALILDELKNSDIYNGLFSIEPMPKYSVSLNSLSGNEIEIPTWKPQNDKDYVKVGILDSGIEPISYLFPWVFDRWSPYPSSDIDPSHGTFVSGVALYGDRLEGEDWIGHNGFQILDAAVFPDTNKTGLEEDELLENIKEVVRIYHSQVKIWNLSISVVREITESKFSDFAIALDDIQDKYNVLICKSAGNCSNFAQNLPVGRLHEGADSIRSLVVGSVANSGNLSSFSRVGPGPEFIIKPEIVHVGGNAEVDKNSGRLTQTGVKSFSVTGEVSTSAGTSYSTPRIASLAAAVHQELSGDFDPLLVKALIVHSANYHENLEISNDERTKFVGFGTPQNVRNILYNTPHEATLILQDYLKKSEFIDIMEFPMPECLIKNGYFTGQIVATLISKPLLDSTQGAEYCQSNLDFKFGSYDEKEERDTSRRGILNPVGRSGAENLFRGTFYSKTKLRTNTGSFALQERNLIKFGDKFHPVKKHAIDLEELTDGNKEKLLNSDRKWFLKLEGLFRDNIEQKALESGSVLRQEYCLIITIRDAGGNENVYDAVTQKLEEYNFWHSPIKISSDVEISV